MQLSSARLQCNAQRRGAQAAQGVQHIVFRASNGARNRANSLPAPGRKVTVPAASSRPAPRRRVTVRAASAAAVPEPSPSSLPQARPQAVKIAGLGILFFASTFCYTILQNLKDSIIVTSVGAEALPFLEAYGVLPASLAFFILYNKLNQRLPESWVYRACLAPFLSFYAIFGAFLYPNADKLHPTHLLEGMKAAMPAGLVGLAGMLVHWSYSLFFIMGELWGGVAISLLFWGLADEVCTMHEAESVYPLLGIIANVGLVLAGAWIKTVNASGTLLASIGLQPVQALIATVIAMSAVLFTVKGFVHDNFVRPDYVPVKRPVKGGKKKGGKTLAESLAVLKNSPKVGNLAILVISYFISQKLFDFAWKAQLRVLYPCTEAYQQVLADVAQWTGITTIVLMASSKMVFKWGGWAAAALATPLTVVLTGAAFFASAIAMQGGASFLGPEAVSVLLAVGGIAGVAGRVASRAPKYSLFDPAKEMVYITMSKEEKKEGKAAVDLLGSYFGKSGASWIMQILVLTTGHLTSAMPLMAMIHVVVGVAWTKATFSLAALMQNAKAEQAQKEAEAAAAAAAEQAEAAATTAAATATAAVAGTSNGFAYAHANGNGNGRVYAANGNGQELRVGGCAESEDCDPCDPCVVPESMFEDSVQHVGLSGSVQHSSVTFRK